MIDFIAHYGGYGLSALGITGQLLAGRRNAWGWILGLVSQCAWVTYIAATDQWSLIWGTVAYAVTYVINFRTERRKQRTERNQPTGPTVEELTEILDLIAEDEPCIIDRYGDCVGHGWFQDITPGSCPHARGHAILTAAGYRKD